MENTSGALMADVLIALISRLSDQTYKVNLLQVEVSDLKRANEGHQKLRKYLDEQISVKDQLIMERNKAIDDFRLTVERLESENAAAMGAIEYLKKQIYDLKKVKKATRKK